MDAIQKFLPVLIWSLCIIWVTMISIYVLMQPLGLHKCCYEFFMRTQKGRWQLLTESWLAPTLWHCHIWQVIPFSFSQCFNCKRETIKYEFLIFFHYSWLQALRETWYLSILFMFIETYIKEAYMYLCSAKPKFFHDEYRQNLFAVDTDSGMLINTDNGSPMAQVCVETMVCFTSMLLLSVNQILNIIRWGALL